MNVRVSAANVLTGVSLGSSMSIAKSATDTRSTPFLPTLLSSAPLGDFNQTEPGLALEIQSSTTLILR